MSQTFCYAGLPLRLIILLIALGKSQNLTVFYSLYFSFCNRNIVKYYFLLNLPVTLRVSLHCLIISHYQMTYYWYISGNDLIGFVKCAPQWGSNTLDYVGLDEFNSRSVPDQRKLQDSHQTKYSRYAYPISMELEDTDEPFDARLLVHIDPFEFRGRYKRAYARPAIRMGWSPQSVCPTRTKTY